MAVAAPRRGADRNEHRVGLRHRRRQSVVKSSRPALTLEATSASRPGSKIGISPRCRPRSAGVLVDAGDVVTEIGKTGAGNKPHIARANHGNPHENNRL